MDERPRNPGPSQDPRFTQALGRTIKVLRTDHGLSRKDLARQVDMSYSYLTEIENGNKPPSNTILGAIANVLDMHLHELSLIHISEPTRLRRISYAVFCLK